MKGTPASSPGARRGAGMTCTCTCPGPPSRCGYLRLACLAREGRITELSKEDRMALDTLVSELSRSPPLYKVLPSSTASAVFHSDSAHWLVKGSAQLLPDGRLCRPEFPSLQYCLHCMNTSVCFSNYFITRLHCPFLIL